MLLGLTRRHCSPPSALSSAVIPRAHLRRSEGTLSGVQLALSGSSSSRAASRSAADSNSAAAACSRSQPGGVTDFSSTSSIQTGGACAAPAFFFFGGRTSDDDESESEELEDSDSLLEEPEVEPLLFLLFFRPFLAVLRAFAAACLSAAFFSASASRSTFSLALRSLELSGFESARTTPGSGGTTNVASAKGEPSSAASPMAPT